MISDFREIPPLNPSLLGVRGLFGSLLSASIDIQIVIPQFFRIFRCKLAESFTLSTLSRKTNNEKTGVFKTKVEVFSFL